MQGPRSFTGGARIGWSNASWPFAKLTVERDRIDLRMLGHHVFTPDQVVAIESVGAFPFGSRGVRIRHNRIDQPERVIFVTWTQRQRVLDAVAESGFVARGDASKRAKGFPLEWWFVALEFAVWNGLLLLQRLHSTSPGEFGPYSWAALLIAFLSATAIRKSPRIQHVVMRPGHVIGEIDSSLLFFQVMMAFLLTVSIVVGNSS